MPTQLQLHFCNRKRVLFYAAIFTVFFFVAKLVVRRSAVGGQDNEVNNNAGSWGAAAGGQREVKGRSRKRGPNGQTEYVDKHGMHVVVGRYVGDSLANPNKTPNLTDAEINANNYWPVDGAGEGGEPVFLKNREMLKSKRLYHINKFNIVVSDRISLNRSLPDIRKPGCQSKEQYNDNAAGLPDASIIIVFHNEAWSTLLRTVHSVVNRTPGKLLREIILVDDASNRTFLKRPLEDYIERHLTATTTRLIRSPERVGLIKARLLGAAKAEGRVLLFLDAHCEATRGWAEPLLARIAENPKAAVCPVIDIINDDNFQYIKSFSLHWGGFNWELNFRWFTMGQRVLEEFREDGGTSPYRTPVMAGGLFAIDRSFFYQVGSYDDQMDIWGGENLELSFRVWMCGGSVEIAPCSHVGHIFRKGSPYTFPREGGVGAVLNGNLARVASVWMDRHSQFYFKVNEMARKLSQGQDVSRRKRLRQELQCKSFRWYLDNVWPEHFFPTEDRFFGKLRHVASDQCLQKPGRTKVHQSAQPTGNAALDTCVNGFYAPQQIVMTDSFSSDDVTTKKNSGDITGGGFVMADESVCLDSPTVDNDDPEASVRFQACNEMTRQRFVFSPVTQLLTHWETGKCVVKTNGATSDTLILSSAECDHPNAKWDLMPDKWTIN